MSNYTLCILGIILLIGVCLSYRVIQGNVLYARILIDEEGLKPFRKEYCKIINKCIKLLEKDKQKFELYKLELGLNQVTDEDAMYHTMYNRADAIAHFEFERMDNVKDFDKKLDFVLAYLRGINLYEETCKKLENSIFTRGKANKYVRKHYDPVQDIYGFDVNAFAGYYPTVTVKCTFGSFKLLVDYKVIEAIIRYAEAVGVV